MTNLSDAFYLAIDRSSIKEYYDELTNNILYDFDYYPVDIQCKNCKETFSHKELKFDIKVNADFNYNFTFNSSCKICPKCNYWECCDLKKEYLTFFELQEIFYNKKNEVIIE